ncbi:MAG TPA: hypothetical protein VFU62_08635 [Hanamia sp.]|nr:hypothetical protein [Hanamia sp.]
MIKLILYIIISISSFIFRNGYGQTTSFDKVNFFEDTSIIHATILTDMGKIFRKKEKPGLEFPANFSITLPDGSTIQEPIILTVRGHFRREKCFLPPLLIDFKDKKTSVLKPLGSLKLVSQCYTSEIGTRYLLSEYLLYKIYNLLTDISFRVRLLNLKLADSSGKKKPITEYAFLMENIKNVAKRNNCVYIKAKIDPRNTNNYQMTMAAIFEYMIGNTDFGVFVNHNTRLLLSKTDSLHKPLVVPYDFDFSGFVNTNYSIPDPNLEISDVRTRLYRGFPEPIQVINEVVDIFKKQKDSIYALIKNFDLLPVKSKNELTSYLDDFFKLINNPAKVKETFIQNARSE